MQDEMKLPLYKVGSVIPPKSDAMTYNVFLMYLPRTGQWEKGIYHGELQTFRLAGQNGEEYPTYWTPMPPPIKRPLLKDVLPRQFFGEFMDSEAAKHLEVPVLIEFYYNAITGHDTSRKWPGKEKNINGWWVLANGKAVGWNENPARGWSFPVIPFNDQQVLFNTVTTEEMENGFPGFNRKAWRKGK